MNNWLHSAHVSKQQSRQEPKCSNTSTDVEKTHQRSMRRCDGAKHLHGRGEDQRRCALPDGRTETPPRTWRRPTALTESIDRLGNTSTDVEKTHLRCVFLQVFEKHLHGRGEDANRLNMLKPGLETPPRTWRRRQPHCRIESVVGNTSTDVEKTGARKRMRKVLGKHLHGRGEDRSSKERIATSSETPPRTWRRLNALRGFLVFGRNTSTDVEKTELNKLSAKEFQKHLHGRGEDRDTARPRRH